MREHRREKSLDGELKGGRRGAVGGGEAEGLRRACGDPREERRHLREGGRRQQRRRSAEQLEDAVRRLRRRRSVEQ